MATADAERARSRAAFSGRRNPRSHGCSEAHLLRCAAEEYACHVDVSRGRMFDFGLYAEMPMEASPNVAALASLAALLAPLLRAAPHAVINQRNLAGAFTAVLIAREVPPGLAVGRAERAAGQTRTALAHLRRLLQCPRVGRQRFLRASAQDVAALEDLHQMYARANPSARSSPTATGSDEGASAGAAALELPSGALSLPIDENDEGLAEEEAPPTSFVATRTRCKLGRLPSLPDSPARDGGGSLQLAAHSVAESAPGSLWRAVNGALDAFCARAAKEAPAYVSSVAKAARRAVLFGGSDSAPQRKKTKIEHLATVGGASSSQAAIVGRMHVVFYRRMGAFGCRVHRGRQLFQVVVPGNAEDSRQLAEEGRRRLLAGDGLERVRAWVAAEKLTAAARSAANLRE